MVVSLQTVGHDVGIRRRRDASFDDNRRVTTTVLETLPGQVHVIIHK